MIPEGWEEASLGELTRDQVIGTGLRGGGDGPSLPLLKMGNILWGGVDLRDVEQVGEAVIAGEDCRVTHGDILFNTRNTPLLVGKTAFWHAPFVAAIDNNIMRIRLQTETDSAFIARWMGSNFGRKAIGRFVCASTSVGAVYWRDLRKLKLPLPPLPEQRRITEILSTWDRAIETVEALIANARAQKQALMQQLLPQGTTPPKKRLPGFSDEWREVRLGNLVKEVNRDVDWDDEATYKLISVRRRSEGIFHRESLLGHEILTKAMKVALAGDFLISKMQIVHGASALVKADSDGFNISGSYIALVPKDQAKLDIGYFDWYSRTPYFYKLAYISSYGVHIEKMTFNLKSFLKQTILMPPSKAEQSAIVEQLNSAEALIGSYQSQADALRQEKAALMQQLLTGKRRVKLLESEVA